MDVSEEASRTTTGLLVGVDISSVLRPMDLGTSNIYTYSNPPPLLFPSLQFFYLKHLSTSLHF